MKARLDAGTDVAMIGAWDAQRDSTPLSADEQKRFSNLLEADAAEGHLFLVRTGKDGSGPIDLYVDEPMPDEVRDRLLPSGHESLLALPSGALVVDGAEYYRAPTRAPERSRAITVPAGQYSVRCYITKDEEQTPKSEDELRTRVGSADLAYYDRLNKTGCLLGAATLLLFPILWFPLGWKIALAVTAVIFVSFFHVREWVLKRNARYKRLDAIVPAFRIANEDPWFVFELRSVRDRGADAGGRG
jgi:hypothetical protein